MINYIAAQPSPARFVRSAAAGGATLTLNVRMSEPQKTRELRQGGLQPSIIAEATIVLPVTAAAPDPEKERIDIVDMGGAYKTYDIASVTPLRGLGCYNLGLRNRNNTPVTTRPPSPA